MNIRLLISVVLVAQLVLAVDDAVEGAVLEAKVEANNTEVSCVTADGDEGVCGRIENCQNLTESRRERLINCGSVLRGKINEICCPRNATFDDSILNGYTNDANCGRHFDHFNVVGGSVVPPHFDPWTVAIYQVVRFPATSASNFSSQQYYRFICGGTLVSRQHVVSAAHCVVHGWPVLGPDDFLIKVGASNIDTTGTLHKVEKVFAHENYRSYQRYNDISMFKLAVPVRSEYGLAACLPTRNFVFREGTQLTVAGWGTTSFLGKLSQNLREAKVSYINNAECSRNYTRLEGSSTAYPQGISSSMICAGNRLGGVDSCQGDSGGPLTYTDPRTNQVYLVGVTSFGYKCAAPFYPGVYTRTSTYLAWILQAMRR